MKNVIAGIAMTAGILTAMEAAAHEYNQGGYEIDSFYTEAGIVAHVELTVHEPLSKLSCRVLNSEGKTVASQTLASYSIDLGWNTMSILYTEGSDVSSVKCQARK